MDTARFANAGSALAVGTFGWLLAHSLTFWLLAHGNHGALTAVADDVHGLAASASVVGGCLAVASMLAVGLTIRPARHGRSSSPQRRRTAVPLAVGLSTGAFLVADVVEHQLLGLGPVQPSFLVLGLCLHAVLGAGSSMLWLSFTDAVRGLLRRSRPVTAQAERHSRLHDASSRRRREHLWAYAVAGRAPPVA